MILEPGEKIHVITRRHFENDLRRHFIGEIIKTSEVAVRVEGYAFVLDTSLNQFIKRKQKRTRIFGLADSGNIINVLPTDADLELAKYTQTKENVLVVTDGKTFALDINEFGSNR